jgi:hypothetical protein
VSLQAAIPRQPDQQQGAQQRRHAFDEGEPTRRQAVRQQIDRDMRVGKEAIRDGAERRRHDEELHDVGRAKDAAALDRADQDIGDGQQAGREDQDEARRPAPAGDGGDRVIEAAHRRSGYSLRFSYWATRRFASA